MTEIEQATGPSGPADLSSVRVPSSGSYKASPADRLDSVTVTLAAEAVEAALSLTELSPEDVGLLVIGLPLMPPRDAGVPGQALLDNAFNHALVKQVALENGLKAALPLGISDPAPAGAALDLARLLLGDGEQDDFATAVVVAVEVSRDPEDLGWPLSATATVVTTLPDVDELLVRPTEQSF